MRCRILFMFNRNIISFALFVVLRSIYANQSSWLLQIKYGDIYDFVDIYKRGIFMCIYLSPQGEDTFPFCTWISLLYFTICTINLPFVLEKYYLWKHPSPMVRIDAHEYFPLQTTCFWSSIAQVLFWFVIV